MKLIAEQVEDIKYLTEEVGPDKAKTYYIEGIFLQANKKNRNGRMYPKDILQREVARYTVNYIVPNRAFGELGHPDSPTINLDRVSHVVKNLKEDGDNYFGRAKILDTPYGKIVKNFIDEGVKLGVSSRGLGSLKSVGGTNMVQDDFFLASAADIVADPSAPDAFVQGIMEGKEWILEGTGWKEIDYNAAKKAIEEAAQKDLEAIKIKVFEDFINKLELV